MPTQLLRIASICLICLVVQLFLAEPGFASLRVAGDECWSEGFPLPVPSGQFNAAAVYDGLLVLGRDPSNDTAGESSGVITWNGLDWGELGSGILGDVDCLVVWNGLLVAGGDFIIAGGGWSNRIAAWDGMSWQPLGNGMDGPVHALGTHDGKLIAGGDFAVAGAVAARRVAAWDGVSWSALGEGFNDQVNCIADYAGTLVIGGWFTASGLAIVNGIAAWNGNDWQAMGWGMDGDVNTLAVYGGELVAGGDFTWSGLEQSFGLATWDGVSWSAFGLSEQIDVRQLFVYDGDLIISARVDYDPAIFGWNGSSWFDLDDARALARAFAAYGGELVALIDWYGPTSPGEGTSAPAWAWNGATWRILMSEGLVGAVRAFVEWNDLLVVGGNLEFVSGEEAGGIAAWDGLHWQAFNGGFEGTWDPGMVSALGVYGGELYAGGSFASADGMPIASIARWNGAAWEALGQGLPGDYDDGSVRSLVAHDGKLFAGGEFYCPDLGEWNIAAWNGVAWESVGGGGGYVIRDLLPLDPTHLIAAGYFWSLGGVSAQHIAMWDGAVWTELDGGVSDGVHDLEMGETGLLVAGDFTDVDNGSIAADGLALWNTAGGWTPLITALGGPDSYAFVRSVTVFDEHVVAGGYFDEVDGVEAENIAFLDVAGWAPLGSGIFFDSGSATVNVMRTYREGLMVGGNFDSAGGKPSSNIGRYGCGLPLDAGTPPPQPLTLLGRNYPNPFNPRTTIPCDLPAATTVSLRVHDVSGRCVRVLVAEERWAAGSYEIPWNGQDDAGRALPSGVYFCRIKTDTAKAAMPMVLLK